MTARRRAYGLLLGASCSGIIASRRASLPLIRPRCLNASRSLDLGRLIFTTSEYNHRLAVALAQPSDRIVRLAGGLPAYVRSLTAYCAYSLRGGCDVVVPSISSPAHAWIERREARRGRSVALLEDGANTYVPDAAQEWKRDRWLPRTLRWLLSMGAYRGRLHATKYGVVYSRWQPSRQLFDYDEWFRVDFPTRRVDFHGCTHLVVGGAPESELFSTDDMVEVARKMGARRVLILPHPRASADASIWESGDVRSTPRAGLAQDYLASCPEDAIVHLASCTGLMDAIVHGTDVIIYPNTAVDMERFLDRTADAMDL